MSSANIEIARHIYSLETWGNGYLDINSQGHLLMRPDPQGNPVDLFNLISGIQQLGLRFPVLVRFPDILKHRVTSLCSSFNKAASELAYDAPYTAVYPIKVNQQHCVVRDILHAGNQVGLEAGSKPELMAVLALSKPQGVIVCNGYKDREYIRLALIGQKLGQRVYIVVEKPSEISLILQEAVALNIEPCIGIRIRLASVGKGKWQNSGGEKAKFGLSASQVLKAVNHLKQTGKLHCLKLLHFHMGSQIANIHDLQTGLQEAARHFVELHALGAKLEIFDAGGGLAVDYDGSGSRNECSMNYSLDEYAINVLRIIQKTCRHHALNCPQIFTESGRALTAHHAMLISKIIETEIIEPEVPETICSDNECLRELQKLLGSLKQNAAIEQHRHAQFWFDRAQQQYNDGQLSLAGRAQVEQIFFAICRQLQGLLQHSSRVQRETLDEINEKMADKYFCNFSVFQSMPDVWGIDQVFPIVPLHRLNEAPDRRGIIHDLTCDSDGHIEYYADSHSVEKTLPLHAVRKGEDYWLGMFLLGAYQEILGDMHNLFGDTDAINVELDARGGYKLTEPEYGDSVEQLLSYVHFNIDDMMHAYQQKISAANLAARDSDEIMAALQEGIKGYTYFER
ncbi:MAG: arginine decarboxylase [Pseudomonadota bacterium]|nr:arginine decarboxylase [Pseudomonadota bacterium]